MGNRKNVASKPAHAILIVQDQISDVCDGLARAHAIADLLEASDPEDPPECVTVVRAAEAIRLELDRMSRVLQDNIRTLDEAKKRIGAPNRVSLEVVRARCNISAVG